MNLGASLLGLGLIIMIIITSALAAVCFVYMVFAMKAGDWTQAIFWLLPLLALTRGSKR